MYMYKGRNRQSVCAPNLDSRALKGGTENPGCSGVWRCGNIGITWCCIPTMSIHCVQHLANQCDTVLHNVSIQGFPNLKKYMYMYMYISHFDAKIHNIGPLCRQIDTE